jgi:hypothetical protein
MLYLQGEAAPGIKVYRKLGRPQPRSGQCSYNKNTFRVYVLHIYSHQRGKKDDIDLSVADWNQTYEIYSGGKANILRGDSVCTVRKESS